MYEFENNFLSNEHIEFNLAPTEEEMTLFEQKYAVKLPLEIKEFYPRLNGYYYVNDMVDFYSFDKVTMLQESYLNRPFMPAIDHFFLLGDFCFQGSFWLLEILSDICVAYGYKCFSGNSLSV